MEKKYFNKIIFLLGPYRNSIPIMIFLFIFLSSLEVIGIGIIGPYISIILNDSEFINLEKFNLFDFSAINTKLLFSICLVLVFFIKSILAVTINYYILKFSFNCQTLLRDSLLRKYQNMNYIEFSTRNSSDYIQNMQILVGEFSNSVIHTGLRVISEILVLLCILTFLAVTNIKLFIFFVLFFSLLILIYDKIFSNTLNDLGKESSEASRKIIQSVQESVKGFKEVLIFNIKHYFKNNVHVSAENFSNAHINYTLIKTAPQYLLEFFIILILVIVVLFASTFNIDTKNLVSSLGVFAFAAMRIKPSVTILSQGISKLRYGVYATEKLFYDLESHNELTLFNTKNDYHNSSELDQFYSLNINNIFFSYDNDIKNKKWIIEGLSLNILKGQIIGIIGDSGAGKTTLVDILLGLIHPQKGEILYNDKNIKDYKYEWRSKLGYLPQEIFIIDSSIRNNIALGIENRFIDDEKVRECLEKAKLYDFVMEMPEKEYTFIGEGGIKLSGGQRQRIALARAFYHNKEILVLDESTSALDPKTEKEIVDYINTLKGKKTIIVIAHRHSTLKECDKIYKINKGKIDKSGTYVDIYKEIAKD